MREVFDQNGYLYVPNAVDFKSLYCSPPVDKEGQRITGIEKHLKYKQVEFNPIEPQVNGSLARYNHPFYKATHYSLMKDRNWIDILIDHPVRLVQQYKSAPIVMKHGRYGFNAQIKQKTQ